eukprot:4847211-Ditylum_brightwellii.AAC.1
MGDNQNSLREDLDNWLKDAVPFQADFPSDDAAAQEVSLLSQSHHELLQSFGPLQTLEGSESQACLAETLQRDFEADTEPMPLQGVVNNSFFEDVLISYEKKLQDAKRKTHPKKKRVQKAKKQRSYSAPPFVLAPSCSTQGMLYKLEKTMEESTRSDQRLSDWDRRMGLRKNHCRTMGATRKSRRRLSELQKKVGFGPMQSSAKGA